MLIAVALYLALTQNASLARAVLGSLPASLGPSEFTLLAAIFFVLVNLHILVLALLSPPGLLKPALTSVLILASVCSYFMDKFGVVIDQAMMVNIMGTDRREAVELLRPALLAHVLLYGGLPATVVLRTPVRADGLVRGLVARSALITLALFSIGACIALQYHHLSLWGRANRDIRAYVNPVSPMYRAVQYVSDDHSAAPDDELTIIAPDARRVAGARDARPFLVVLVVGETARAENFQLNGYGRSTNPKLAAIDELISYTDVSSCGTSTAHSLPCMFSVLGRKQFTRKAAARQQNLLDVLQYTGVNITWRDNNSGCKGVCARVAGESLQNDDDPELCASGECRDEILIRDIQDYFPQAGGASLLVLHQKGSHGPAYYKRYPAEMRRFLPDCNRDEVWRCSREEIVNAYDNTIAYTDDLLSRIIDTLRSRQEEMDAVLIYVSDHGESLGENGIYLHGLPYALAPREQKHVPLLAWFSSGAARTLDLACVRKGRTREYSHDNLFHSLLGLFNVQTKAYESRADIFKSCRHD